jgi:cyclopropane fatty-acyl-phospholipid synthase-like methyltransferase
MRAILNRLIYDLMYRLAKPVWDTGLTPPEVVEAIQKERTPGRALDLGCGTGTHSIYLAQHGWKVVGVDFSPKAIALAREKANHAGVNIDFRIADVSRIDGLVGPFDFALDVGCFHGLDVAGQARYVAQLTRLMRSGGKFLLWAFDRPAPFEDYGILPEVVEQLFAPHFVMSHSEHGIHNRRSTTWYWFTRR